MSECLAKAGDILLISCIGDVVNIINVKIGYIHKHK